MKKCIIVAIDEKLGIGKNGRLPWHNPADLKRFKKLTKNSICVMGYNTYKEIADRFDYDNTSKFLPNRISAVITSKSIKETDNIETGSVKSFKSIKECIDYFENINPSIFDNLFFIGGYGIFKESFKYDIDVVYLTSIRNDYLCDVFFPEDIFNQLIEYYEQKITNGDNNSYEFIDFYKV